MTLIAVLNRCPCSSQCRLTHSVSVCHSSLHRTPVQRRAVSSHNSSIAPCNRTNSINRCRANSRCLNNHSNRSGRPPLAQVETLNSSNLAALTKASSLVPSEVRNRLNSRTICLTACSSSNSHRSTQAAVSRHSTLVCKCHSLNLKIRVMVVLAGSRTRRNSQLPEANITVDWSTWLPRKRQQVSSYKVHLIGVLLYE